MKPYNNIEHRKEDILKM